MQSPRLELKALSCCRSSFKQPIEYDLPAPAVPETIIHSCDSRPVAAAAADNAVELLDMLEVAYLVNAKSLANSNAFS